MSVINKVLRDLDERKTAPSDRAQESLRAGTYSVAPPPPAQKAAARRAGPMLVLLLMLAASLVAVYGWWQSAPALVPATAPTSAPEVVVAAATPPPALLEPAVPLSVFRMESQLNLKGWNPRGAEEATPAAPLATPAKPTKPTKPEAVSSSLSLSVPLSAPPSTPTVAAAVVSTAEPASVGQRQQLAGREALAQAQSLWNSGARDAAVDLLQEAIAAAERNVAGNPAPANTQVLAALVREWARMLLAELRPLPVYELLTRLEPALRQEPDVWALRANAAQRMGRHQDSVLAYTAALQFRPNEQRWLLGVAVSLAALGQTAAAADMAEKARAVGIISPDVQAYLRQAGVPVKDK